MNSPLSSLTHVHKDSEGVPLQPSLLSFGIAAAAIVAIAALFVSVLGVIY